MKRRKKLRYLLGIAVLASASSLFVQLWVTNAGIRNLFLHVVINLGMTGIAFGWKNRREFLENCFFLYVTVLFLGGIMEWEETLGLGAWFFWAKALVAAVLLSVVTICFGRRRDFFRQIYVVEIVHRNQCIQTNAYWDSGNLLVDPYMQKPVNILSKKMAEQLFDSTLDLKRYVPYCSLGQTNGLIEVYNAEFMYILQEGKRIAVTPAVFGIAEEELLEGKEYDVILQASVMEGENENAYETNSAEI